MIKKAESVFKKNIDLSFKKLRTSVLNVFSINFFGVMDKKLGILETLSSSGHFSWCLFSESALHLPCRLQFSGSEQAIGYLL